MGDKHQLTWLITGASSGFGKSLALAALNSGHRVIGTSRDVPNAQRSLPEFQGNRAMWLYLDPGSPTASEVVTQLSVSNEIDVLVNNAGYAFIGGVEDTRYTIENTSCNRQSSHVQLAAKRRFVHKWKSTSTVHSG